MDKLIYGTVTMVIAVVTGIFIKKKAKNYKIQSPISVKFSKPIVKKEVIEDK